MIEQSDEELYRQMRSGNQRAFAELYERHEPALFRYALHSSGSRTIAEEVAHEVFIQLLKPGQAFDPARAPLDAYLYGIARHLVRALRRQIVLEPSGGEASTGDPLGELMRTELMTALHRAIRELPERYRDAVVLCDLEERSYAEGARIMGCPVGTLRSRLHRARGLLTAKLRGPASRPAESRAVEVRQ